MCFTCASTGLRAEKEAVADPLVESALGHECEHLALALSERGERAVGSGPLDEARDEINALFAMLRRGVVVSWGA